MFCSAADLFIINTFHPVFTEIQHPMFRPCRISYTGRKLGAIDTRVLPYCLVTDGRLREPHCEDINSNSLFVTTSETAFSLMLLNMKGIFTHILIDEGGQAIEPETLIPLALADEHTKVVIAGDHLQVSGYFHMTYIYLHVHQLYTVRSGVQIQAPKCGGNDINLIRWLN